jgi:hypothetical protein
LSHTRWDGPCWGLTIKVDSRQELSLDEIRAFLAGGGRSVFRAGIARRFTAERTGRCGRSAIRRWAGRGLVREYVAKMTGLSRAQVTRLIRQYPRGEQVQPKAHRRRKRRGKRTQWEIVGATALIR